MNCGTCDSSIPDYYLDSEHLPEILRNEFGVTGSKYGLVVNRDVPVLVAGEFSYDESADTYTLLPSPWTEVTISFAEDLTTSTPVLFSYTLPIADAGIIDPGYSPGAGGLPDPAKSERFTATIPASEMNKLEGKGWVIAEVLGGDNSLISRCVFYVVGGS